MNNQLPRAFIFGCGYTGERLARRLAAAGTLVTGTRAGPGAPGDLDITRLDLIEGPAPPLEAAAGAMVYYMIPTLSREYGGRGGPHRRFMDNALAGLDGQAIRGLVYLSSTSIYGDAGGGWVDEHTPPAPRSPWARMRLELEERLQEYGQGRGVPAWVVRLPEIYGPGRGPVARLRAGYTLRYPDRFSNRIHVEDLAMVLHELGCRIESRVESRLLLVSDGHPATSAEVYDHAARLLGMGSVPRGGEVQGDANRQALASESKRCRDDRLLQWLGRPLKYPTYKEGLPATL